MNLCTENPRSMDHFHKHGQFNLQSLYQARLDVNCTKCPSILEIPSSMSIIILLVVVVSSRSMGLTFSLKSMKTEQARASARRRPNKKPERCRQKSCRKTSQEEKEEAAARKMIIKQPKKETDTQRRDRRAGPLCGLRPPSLVLDSCAEDTGGIAGCRAICRPRVNCSQSTLQNLCSRECLPVRKSLLLVARALAELAPRSRAFAVGSVGQGLATAGKKKTLGGSSGT